MLAIEKSLKKSFKNLDENNASSDILKIQVGPVQFTKICVSLMWFMLVYLHFKENDSSKVNKVSLKSVKNSTL